MKTKYGYYKVATGNFKVSVGNIKKNGDSIISLINEAKIHDSSLIVFPELSLTGYTLQDLYLRKETVENVYTEIKRITEEINDDIIAFIGGPLYYHNKLFDVCYVIRKNKVLGIVPKSYLPNYNEFYEKRWFSSSFDADFDEVIINEEKIPFGNDLIFEVGEMKVGTEICEDLWVINPPSNNYSLNGADVIVNLSASNDYVSKREYRRNLVMMQSYKNYCAYIYSSSGLGESSQDLVFSGHQMIYQNGKLISESLDEKGVLYGIIDIELIENQRMKYKSTFECKKDKDCRFINTNIETNLDLLPEYVNPYPFLVKDEEKRNKRSEEILSYQAKGLATKLSNTHFDKVVLGVSGGLDSTLALLVINEAFKMLGIPTSNIICLSMPGFGTTSLTFNNAYKLIKLVKASYEEIDIKDMCTAELKALNHPTDLYDTTYENVQARMRTELLMNKANYSNALVIGTGDLSELALGFCTYNGDHMSMYGVNCSVPKTLVKTLIHSYGLKHTEYQEVLESIINTPISPELLPAQNGKIAQKTETILGKYDLHDFFLFNYLRNGYSFEKIEQLSYIAFKDIEKEYIKKTLNIFKKRFFSQQFKRSCLPDGVKVGSVSLSPRGDLRLSSDLEIDE